MSDKPDLIATLRHYDVEVSDARREQLVLCPAHSENVPSCSVNIEQGLFKCHSCGAAGDAFSLIQIKENCDFATAVAFAKANLGYVHEGVRGAASSKPSRQGLSGVSRPVGGGYRPKIRARIQSPSGA